MLIWYKNLYVGETAKKKEKKVIRRLNGNRKVRGVYLITLASNGVDQLDILSASQFLGRSKREITPAIVGIAGNYPEALELVEQMALEAFSVLGNADIRSYLNKIEEEGK